ncbi:methyltransferase domain-containing protein [Nocardia terpenica]|uniref:class I SAM-dependent methyltransferase n=1 Tax=Nocardia terpenica TaxID=455432 RepID=UPI0018932121|nr:class I SAM-dependent methyltransferase [Nocardia terpenica]MBF6064737.1 methyltransferase domain-containing protein [Nocardia terpenica]MBF6107252.1 methyltransferase domain-containing protein [Nocardia terpenica]MBF6115009.1 methyltransferase domain-containing protein [Nocardia terpenica]MBF6122115.1 methyltransferase domain-containing protein [Nocardia terpenica]MBF6154498.1 methyltransferase domain-containing protein [Nocardia terpenica]
MDSEFDQETIALMRANERNWDARTPIHAVSRFYDAPAEWWFAPFEWDDLGSLADRDLAHLQCHLGTETIAFARRGARAVGLDFSERAVEQARRIADRHGVAVDYVRADVYDAVTALGARRFDIVYTGKGSLCYLPDLPRWAAVLATLLRPGGRVYIVEFHPLLTALGPKPGPDEPDLVLRHDYLEGRGPIEHDGTHTYTDGPALPPDAARGYEWAHGIGEVVTALVEAGLTITRLRETELLPWPRWKRMVRDEPSGWWKLPSTDVRVPLLYALTAVRG